MSEPVTSFWAWLTLWRFTGPQFILVAFVAAVYLVGLLRLQFRSGWRAVPLREMLYGVGGFAVLLFALSGPPEALADEMFFLHMTQHILVAMVASVLLLAARPMSAYLWALPETVRIGLGPALSSQGWLRAVNAALTNPRVALPLFVLTLWLWHIPEAYQLAVRNELVHIFMHLSMLATAVLFWWPIIGPPPVGSRLSYPQRIVYLILVVTPTAVLAAIITLSNTVLYPHYIDTLHHFTLAPAEDQRIGGLLMWIPGNIVYLATLTTLFLRWFGDEDRRNRRAYRVPRSHAAATRRRREELDRRKSGE